MVCRTFNDNWRWSAKSFCRGRLSLYVITGVAAAFTAGFEIPQALGLSAVETLCVAKSGNFLAYIKNCIASTHP